MNSTPIKTCLQIVRVVTMPKIERASRVLRSAR